MGNICLETLVIVNDPLNLEKEKLKKKQIEDK